MSIKHLGVVKNGVEDMENDGPVVWKYTLSTVNGKTELRVDMDITEEFMEYFEKTWPKALDKLKRTG